MRITFAASFADGLRSINSAAADMAAAERQVASGRRLSAPSDDPLGTAAAIAGHAAVARIDAYSGVADAASTRLLIADSALSDIVDQLSAAQTAALAARGSTVTQPQRDTAANELLAIRDALMSDINTQFHGVYLFSGANVTVPPFAKTLAGISPYQGDTSSNPVDVGSSRTVPTTFDGGSIYQGSDPAHVLDVLTQLAAGVRSGDATAIADGAAAVKRAFDRATAAQAQIGNGLGAIDADRTELRASRLAAQAQVSKVEDADLADASIRLAQAQTAYRAALAAMATTGKLSLMDFLN